METTKSKPTKFSCNAPEAQTVFLAGTFNEWSSEVTPLNRQMDGHWQTMLRLPPGHHEFKFIVDGQWCCAGEREPEDLGPAKCVPNEYGTMNCVLEVR